MTEQDLFVFYQEKFRPIYGDLVAVLARKPLEIADEIEAFATHVAVAKTTPDNAIAEDNLSKAQRHLQRACLDAAKMLWLELKKRAEDVYSDKYVRAWCAKDSRRELENRYHTAFSLGLEARKTEISNVGISPEASVDKYYDAANEFQNFLNGIDWKRVENIPKLKWKIAFKQQFATAIVAFLVGILATIFTTDFISQPEASQSEPSGAAHNTQNPR